jgi:NADH:ubiquinone oxidoreductase subunit B-like Fe-S oxidoreductase
MYYGHCQRSHSDGEKTQRHIAGCVPVPDALATALAVMQRVSVHTHGYAKESKADLFSL